MEAYVYVFLHRMVRDPDLADDLTQDVFVKAFRQLESHRPEHSFSSWIVKIANNHALSRRHPSSLRLHRSTTEGASRPSSASCARLQVESR